MTYVPWSPEILRLFMPANKDLMADLLWLQTCYYFGEHFLSDRKYDLLDEYLELIVHLAPEWKRPYRFAGIVLPLEAGDVDRGLEFLDKAIEHHPKAWRFRLYKGVYLMRDKGDLLEASKTLRKAASLPGSPDYLSRLSVTLATKAGRKKLAKRFLQEALDKAGDQNQRRLIREKFKELMSDGNSSGVEGR